MNLHELARDVGVDTDIFCRLHAARALELKVNMTCKAGVAVSIDTTRISREDTEARNLLMHTRQMSFLQHLEMFFQVHLWGEGPKIFRPTTEQLLALEQMNLNIEFRDFHMPFSMIAVELPFEYADKHRDCDNNLPHVTTLYCDKATGITAHNVMFSRTALKAYKKLEDDDLIEDWLREEHVPPKATIDGLLTTAEEFSTEAQIRRAVMNYCLLLDEVGVKDTGPIHPGEYANLVKWCRKSNKHTPMNRRKLKAMARIYRPKAVVQLVRYVSSEGELPSEQPGWKVKPHCRRGHYRMQPTRQGVKRIRIAPVFINAHLLTGPSGGTYTT